MSEVLIFLLDPKANHGQGEIYLNKFFELFRINIKDSHDISVLREHKKIDILIRVGDAYVIVESKYRWAKDQEQQIERYYNEIIENKGASEDAVYVLYLKDGTFPSEHSLNLHLRQKLLTNDKLRCISFPKVGDQTDISMVDFLLEAKKISNSFKMQLFIEDIISNIQGDRAMEQFEKEFFDWIEEGGKERINFASEISTLFSKFNDYTVNNFINELKQQIEKEIKIQLPSFQCEVEPGFGYTSLRGITIFKPEWNKLYDIRIHHDSPSLRDTYVTIKKEKRKNTTKEDEVVSEHGLSSGDTLHVGFRATERQIDLSKDLSILHPENRESIVSEWTNELISFAKKVEKNVDNLVN